MIKLIVLDVDGTLTNGDISYTNKHEEIKTFNVKDGLAVASWTKKLSKKAAIITGRNSKIVEKRATELGITHLFQGIDNKDEVLQAILDEEQITWDEVAAIGDDLNDLKMLKKVGLSFAPNDAVEYIKNSVNIVTASKGGEGAVREMVEYILQYDNLDGLESLWE
jgi:3-deoxy-D-manno-octulosonate 8-phosphate phosphatase (KDO 8-P phosphatase)